MVTFSPFAIFSRREYTKAAQDHSTREDCEENLRQKKAENRRNPLWISRFDNAFLAEICRKTPQAE
jgi:hypothetical protein